MVVLYQVAIVKIFSLISDFILVGKKKKDLLVRLLSVKIAIVIIIVLIFFPLIPVETQIQCFTTPCDPIIEMKSVFQILMKT